MIVLGMLSFMVVSAVGFSIYMRSSRVPSSYLRRNIAARYLARAALAKAIEELEGDVNTDSSWGGTSTPTKFYGIYDDPFPGVVLNDSTARNSTDGLQNGDYWVGRVFMPFGSVSSMDATVSTLTLEGLAYLPPAIVDDVRHLSRRTRTACWRSFPYDAGRYAYCAVNVSDLFDINRLRANVARNSGSDRVTLASLCAENYGDVMSINTSYAQALDNILDRVDNTGNINGNVVPFTSLADFNFAVGNNCEYAPFMRDFVFGTGKFLSSGNSRQANALFITDTWFPPKETAAGQTEYDLGSDAQPFTDYNAASFMETLLKLNPALGSSADNIYTRNLGIGIAALYDYLDSNSRPISLALPTVEAVPMVVGVSAPAGLSPQLGNIGGVVASSVPNLSGTAVPVGSTTGVPVPVPGNTIVANRKCQLYGITSFGNQAIVQVVATSPFKRLAATNRAKTYNVRGLMRVWLAPDGMGCRPAVADNLYPPQADWQDGVKNGVATFLSDTKPLSQFASDIKTTDEAVTETTLRFSNLNVEMPLYYKVEETTPTAPTGYQQPVAADPSNFKANYVSFGDIKNNAKALRPLKVNGEVDDDWKAKVNGSQFNTALPYAPGAGGVTEFDPGSITTKYRLYAAVWLQVMDGANVVDMVPACVTDDNEWLNSNLPQNNAVVTKLGDGAPLLNFKGDRDIDWATMDTALSQPVSYAGWKALYAVDPRYNFAPEDWFSSAASAVASKSEWMQLLGLNGTSSQILGQNGRDRDIFMFVSDQEYLQSIGELQFLPRLDVMDGSGSFLSGEYSPDFHGRAFSNRASPNPANSAFANGGRFWKTYTAFPHGPAGNSSDKLDINPYALKDKNGKVVEVKSGTGGFKLNPFSRDDRVIGAAIVGTPFDYYVASTNSNQRQSGGRKNNLAGNISLSQMMSTYSFGNSQLAKLSTEDLVSIVGEIKDAFEDGADRGDTNWISAWDDLIWQENVASCINDENKTFLAADLLLKAPLHGVDRKFLYSFWRECFDNRQQLFLIFVRAEPSSVGGGGMSRASSQLGSRAVALVWRDPEKPEKNKASRPTRTELNSRADYLNKRGSNQWPPHRTRVLFYHQFD